VGVVINYKFPSQFAEDGVWWECCVLLSDRGVGGCWGGGVFSCLCCWCEFCFVFVVLLGCGLLFCLFVFVGCFNFFGVGFVRWGWIVEYCLWMEGLQRRRRVCFGQKLGGRRKIKEEMVRPARGSYPSPKKPEQGRLTKEGCWGNRLLKLNRSAIKLIVVGVCRSRQREMLVINNFSLTGFDA